MKTHKTLPQDSTNKEPIKYRKFISVFYIFTLKKMSRDTDWWQLSPRIEKVRVPDNLIDVFGRVNY